MMQLYARPFRYSPSYKKTPSVMPLISSSLVHVAIRILEDPSTVSPLTIIVTAINISVATHSVLAIISPFTIVNISIRFLEQSLTMLPPIPPLTLIETTINIGEATHSMHEIVPPFSIIRTTIYEAQYPQTVLLVIPPLALIHVAAEPLEDPSAEPPACLPLPLIGVAGGPGVQASTMPLPPQHPALVDVPTGVGLYSLRQSFCALQGYELLLLLLMDLLPNEQVILHADSQQIPQQLADRLRISDMRALALHGVVLGEQISHEGRHRLRQLVQTQLFVAEQQVRSLAQQQVGPQSLCQACYSLRSIG